jgi:capsular exopolysaccharide synthesis family protein
VDADMRKGRANKIFNVSNKQGLSNYLYNMTGNFKEDLVDAKNYIQETCIPNLHILTNGTIPPNPSELIQSENMKELVSILKNVYDIVIFDAPPCKPVSDSVILSNILDSTIIVTESGKTKINDVKNIKKAIQTVEGNIIGVILNKLKIPAKMYSKNYYYGHKVNDDNYNFIKKISKSVDKVIEESIENISIKNDNDDSLEKELIEVKEEKESELKGNHEKVIENISKEEIREILREEIANKNPNKEIEKAKINYKKIEETFNKEIEETKTNYNKIEETFNKEIEETKTNYNKLEETFNKEIEETKTNYKKLEEVFNKGIKDIKQDNIELLKKEILNMDYKNQIKQINEMLSNLKDDYLELSNIIKANNEKIEKVNNDKIIDIKQLKKQREEMNKKDKIKERSEYSIDEDIPYEELEKTAVYKFSINISNTQNSLLDDEYEGIM